jgi:hypothetical protein
MGHMGQIGHMGDRKMTGLMIHHSPFTSRTFRTRFTIHGYFCLLTFDFCLLTFAF